GTMVSYPGGRKEQADDDDYVALWDPASGELVRRVPDTTGPVAFLPDGKHLLATTIGPRNRATGFRDRGGIKTYEVATAKAVQSLPDSGAYYQLTVSPDGRHAAAISNRTVRVWDLKANRVRYTWPDAGRAVAFHPTRPQVAVLDPARRAVQVWDLDLGRAIHTLSGATDGGNDSAQDLAVAWSPDGTRVAAPGLGLDLRVWDAERPSGYAAIRSPNSSSLNRAAFSADGRRLVLADVFREERGKDPKTGAELVRIVGGPTVF